MFYALKTPEHYLLLYSRKQLKTNNKTQYLPSNPVTTYTAPTTTNNTISIFNSETTHLLKAERRTCGSLRGLKAKIDVTQVGVVKGQGVRSPQGSLRERVIIMSINHKICCWPFHGRRVGILVFTVFIMFMVSRKLQGFSGRKSEEIRGNYKDFRVENPRKSEEIIRGREKSKSRGEIRYVLII